MARLLQCLMENRYSALGFSSSVRSVSRADEKTEESQIFNSGAWCMRLPTVFALLFLMAFIVMSSAASATVYSADDIHRLIAIKSENDIYGSLNWSDSVNPGEFDCVDWVDYSGTNRVGELYLSFRGLEGSLNLEDLDKLTRLSAEWNGLSSLEVSSNTALLFLIVPGNHLPVLDVSSNTALLYIDVVSNELTALDVSRNTALQDLYVGYNQLTALDVSRNTVLQTLDVYGNLLPDLDVSRNTALQPLNVAGNRLTALDVSRNTALQTLNVSGNRLTALDVSSNTALQKLFVGSNQLTALDVSSNTALQYL
ncbi:MAG: hypothetical protein LBT40_18060, partial [Deltaproteobacteria bacterium]|nr:hypothetical protein [Deltaproteobacteria bacterium]